MWRHFEGRSVSAKGFPARYYHKFSKMIQKKTLQVHFCFWTTFPAATCSAARYLAVAPKNTDEAWDNSCVAILSLCCGWHCLVMTCCEHWQFY